MLSALFGWLEMSAAGTFVSQSPYGFAALDMLHIASIAAMFGMIALLDLRLMGLAFTDYPVTVMSRLVLPLTWLTFALSAITGGLMFSGQAARYAANFGFRVKIALLLLAGINVLVFHILTYRGVAKWDRDAAMPITAKFAGAISLACWIAIVFYGRFTAYYHFP